MKKITKLEKQNRAFAKLPKAKQRVAIAKDAIAQIRAGKYEITPGYWAEYLPTRESTTEEDCWGVTLVIADQSTIVKSLRRSEPCRVCQLGSAAVSRIRCGNVSTFTSDSNDMDAVGEALKDIFSLRQMELLEAAFEGESTLAVGHASDASVLQAEAWYVGISNPKRRAIAIWENVIRNKGTFRLLDRPRDFKAV